MNKQTTIFGAILIALTILTSCGNNKINEAHLNIGDDDNMDNVLFNYVKNNSYVETYIFKEQRFDEFGNYNWKDSWKITDFSEEEYTEMKNYANFETYFEKVLNNSALNRKYSWQSIVK